MMKEIIFKDFNKFDFMIDRIFNWWGWRRWWKWWGFGGKEIVLELYYFYFGLVLGVGGGVLVYLLFGLYVLGIDCGESGFYGG